MKKYKNGVITLFRCTFSSVTYILINFPVPGFFNPESQIRRDLSFNCADNWLSCGDGHQQVLLELIYSQSKTSTQSLPFSFSPGGSKRLMPSFLKDSAGVLSPFRGLNQEDLYFFPLSCPQSIIILLPFQV
jgi:hypothetical protein